MSPQVRVVVLSALLASSSQAAEKIIPFSEMSWLAEIPPSELFVVAPRLSLLSKEPQTRCKGAVLDFINGDKIFPVEIDSHGEATLAIPVQYFSEQTKIRLQKDDDAGPCTLTFGVAFSAKSPDRPVRYAEYMNLEAIYDQLVDSQAGVLSMFAPDFEGLQFVFADHTTAAATLVNDDGSEIKLASEQQRIKLPKNSQWLKQNPVVRFNEPPMRIEPLLED